MSYFIAFLFFIALASPWFALWLVARGLSQAFGMIADLYERIGDYSDAALYRQSEATIDSFVLVWFEEREGWFVLLTNGTQLFIKGTVAQAMNLALQTAKAGEADFDCVEDNGSFYRFERCVPEQALTTAS